MIDHAKCGRMNTGYNFTFKYGVVEWKTQLQKGLRVSSVLGAAPGECVQKEGDPVELGTFAYLRNAQIFSAEEQSSSIRLAIEPDRFTTVVSRYCRKKYNDFQSTSSSQGRSFLTGKTLTVSLLWTPRTLQWRLDGQELYTFTKDDEKGEVPTKPLGIFVYVDKYVGDMLDIPCQMYHAGQEHDDQYRPSGIGECPSLNVPRTS